MCAHNIFSVVNFIKLILKSVTSVFLSKGTSYLILISVRKVLMFYLFHSVPLIF